MHSADGIVLNELGKMLGFSPLQYNGAVCNRLRRSHDKTLAHQPPENPIHLAPMFPRDSVKNAMGLFTTLITKIVGPATQVVKQATAGNAAAAPPSANPPAASSSAAMPPPAVAPPVVAEPVDVAAVLDGLAKKNAEKLDWKKSIVDLMKLVGMDSSLAARKELAEELDYSGDMKDSAKMNVWLHKEVLRQLAANGGKVPENLLD